MIQLLPQLKILLAYQPVDFRKGIDGLIGLCRDQLGAEVYDGTLFVFRNRRGTALKILCFDGVGWWLVIRRFSEGRLQWRPKAQADALTHRLEAQQLQVLLYNGLPEQASFVSPWRSLLSRVSQNPYQIIPNISPVETARNQHAQADVRTHSLDSRNADVPSALPAAKKTSFSADGTSAFRLSPRFW